jgi:hypothetical protein
MRTKKNDENYKYAECYKIYVFRRKNALVRIQKSRYMSHNAATSMTHHYQSGKNMKKVIRKVFAEIVAEGDICKKKNKLEAPVFGYLVYVRLT